MQQKLKEFEANAEKNSLEDISLVAEILQPRLMAGLDSQIITSVSKLASDQAKVSENLIS